MCVCVCVFVSVCVCVCVCEGTRFVTDIRFRPDCMCCIRWEWSEYIDPSRVTFLRGFIRPGDRKMSMRLPMRIVSQTNPQNLFFLLFFCYQFLLLFFFLSFLFLLILWPILLSFFLEKSQVPLLRSAVMFIMALSEQLGDDKW